MLVQKQTVNHIKAPKHSFFKREGNGCGIIMRAPQLLPVKRSINIKEIKVSPLMPKRVNVLFSTFSTPKKANGGLAWTKRQLK